MRALAVAGLLAFSVCSVAPADAWGATPAGDRAAPSAEGGRLAIPRAFGRGLVKGVKHTVHAIRPLPRGSRDQAGELLSTRARWMKTMKYGAMVGGIFVAGAAAKAAHIDPEPYMLGLSGLAYAYTLKTRALPILRGKRGIARVEAIGAEVAYPGLLVLGSGLGGMALGHGGEAAAGVSRAAGMLQAGVQSAVIGFDVPTILQGAADHEGMAPAAAH